MAKKNNRIRVLIVEDHPLFREGLRNTLLTRPGIELVGEAANGEEAVRISPLAMLRSVQPFTAPMVMPVMM